MNNIRLYLLLWQIVMCQPGFLPQGAGCTPMKLFSPPPPEKVLEESQRQRWKGNLRNTFVNLFQDCSPAQHKYDTLYFLWKSSILWTKLVSTCSTNPLLLDSELTNLWLTSHCKITRNQLGVKYCSNRKTVSISKNNAPEYLPQIFSWLSYNICSMIS